VKMNGKKQGNH